MKVALIHLHAKKPTCENHADEHLGLGYVGAALRQENFEVFILDDSLLSPEEMLNRFGMSKPRVIGYTLNVENVGHVIKHAEKTRKILPDAWIVFGGHHASLCAEHLLKAGACDIVVAGPGERSMVKICEQIQTETLTKSMPFPTVWADTQFPGFTINQWPLRDGHKGKKTARILSSTGCPHNCVYCTTPAMKDLVKERYRERDAIDFVNEMEALYHEGVRRFYVNDDLFVCGSPKSKKRARKIAEEILHRGLKLQFKVELRADSFDFTKEEDQETVDLLHKAGLNCVFLGLESGSYKMLKALGKGITADRNRQAFMSYEKAGIQVNIGRILFGPDTTWEELSDSIILLGTLGAAWQIFRKPGLSLMVFTGTALERSLEAQGRLRWPVNAAGEELHYLEPSYTVANPELQAFSEALEWAYPAIRPLLCEVFDDRSFGEEKNPDLILELNAVTLLFLNRVCAIGLSGEGFSLAGFNVALDSFLSYLRNYWGKVLP